MKQKTSIFGACLDCEVLCILTIFWLLRAHQSWLKYFFSTVFKRFCSFYSLFSKKSTEKDKFQVPPQGVAKIEKKLALRVSWAVWGKTVWGSTLSLDPFWLPPIGSKFWRFLLVLCSCCWCCCWGWCGCRRHVFVFQKWNQRKSFKSTKKLKRSKKSILTSFWLCTAPESWSKYTTVNSLVFHFLLNDICI